MSFLTTCKRILTDPHPKADESHAATRYEPELPILPELPPAMDTLDQRFAAFHASHPEIFKAIISEADYITQTGVEYMSMKGIFERLRGQFDHLNNSFTSLYTDLLIAKYPHFAPYFHRRARAKGKMKRVYTGAL